jgi:GTP1/Obg family GTP-binding protein
MKVPFKNYKEIILKVLEAINYTDDKEAFINQFATNIYFQSLIDLIQSMPITDQEKIKQKMSTIDNSSEKIDEVIKRYFTEVQRKKALELTAKNAMVNYISAIQDTLSPSQEQNLINLFQRFNFSA